ncbi:MAG: TVP38/TMEM64 family protein, partial [Pirellulaceae bacterium]
MADNVFRWHSRWLVGSCLAIGVLAATWFLATHFSFAELAQREQTLRQLIRSHPAQAWCLGWLVYFVASLVPGTRGKAIAFGWLFGFWPALLLVNPALTAAAMVTFFASRWIVGDMMPSRYSAALRRVNELLERDGGWYVLLLRVVPVSFSLTNYLLGATRVRTRTYWWAT